ITLSCLRPGPVFRRAAPHCRALPNPYLAPQHATDTRPAVSPERRAGKRDHHARRARSLSLSILMFDLLQLAEPHDHRRRTIWTTGAVSRCGGHRLRWRTSDRPDSDTPSIG